ncbi:hypothetical protein RM543_16025 [Roseicyclus sp. F158]|uniref:Uncharacterized protein n=1 Tax=Tropicimonas omnivorans TaxID=3075590 RepID=A0ABU3DKS4_9RHOB|nr:hypothetical protein [Roseicyclus sp. F158]MDT0684193.1 hypothetical protein [Roseicyclus sp. F158]
MRVAWKMFGAAVAGSLATWLLFVTMYRPTEHDYLITTTSYYFKRMSEAGNTGVASFSDCRVESGDASDRRMGIAMFGLCRSETATEKFHFFIALSPTGNSVHSDMEVRGVDE